MSKSTVVIYALVLLAGGGAGYYYWQSQQAPEQVIAEMIEADEPEVQLIVDTSTVKTLLPILEDSDSYMLAAITGLLGNESLMKIFINKNLVQNLVVTIDNLPSMSAPTKVMPIELAGGEFLTAGRDSSLAISVKNAERYDAYMKIVDIVDAKTFVQLYVKSYPLFQQAYEELGYPDKYFNDRLIFVINDLLAAPDVEEPVKLVQPLVVYKYAESPLENSSIGQRIMMRIGSHNADKLKSKLRQIKIELLNHMEKTKLQSAG